MLYLPREGLIAEALEAHTTKFFDTNEASEGLSNKRCTATYFIAPIATFVSRKI